MKGRFGGDKEKTVKDQEKTLQVTEKEAKLLSLLRKMDYGEIVLLVRNGEPEEVEQLSRSVMLDR